MTGVITIDNAAASTVQTGTMKTNGDEDFVAGDKITVDFVYTAGGGPAPMANIPVSIAYKV